MEAVPLVIPGILEVYIMAEEVYSYLNDPIPLHMDDAYLRSIVSGKHHVCLVQKPKHLARLLLLCSSDIQGPGIAE